MYFTPQVYRQFMKRSSSEHIFLSSTQSYDVYRRVESGEAQIGFVEMPMFSARVSATPLFREQMTFVCSCKSKYPENITPAQLNPQHEIMPSWETEFSQWHEYCFGATLPWISIDDMLILEQLGATIGSTGKLGHFAYFHCCCISETKFRTYLQFIKWSNRSYHIPAYTSCTCISA